MWVTDLTSTFTGEGLATIFIAVYHCSAECVGIHAHARATRFEALEPIRQGVRRYFGGFAANVAHGLAIRHDHGSQYVCRADPLVCRLRAMAMRISESAAPVWRRRQHGTRYPHSHFR